MTMSPFIDSSAALPLDADDLEEITPIAHKLAAYGLLPQNHGAVPDRVLAGIEELFLKWYELADDEARRAAVPTLFGSERESRRVLLAIVPLYHDPRFFDDATPTTSLVEVALVAHAKWRRTLE
jgi:hypothetical protein